MDLDLLLVEMQDYSIEILLKEVVDYYFAGLLLGVIYSGVSWCILLIVRLIVLEINLMMYCTIKLYNYIVI